MQTVTTRQILTRPGWVPCLRSIRHFQSEIFLPSPDWASDSFGGAKGPMTCLGPHLPYFPIVAQCRSQLSGSFDPHPRLSCRTYAPGFIVCLISFFSLPALAWGFFAPSVPMLSIRTYVVLVCVACSYQPRAVDACSSTSLWV